MPRVEFVGRLLYRLRTPGLIFIKWVMSLFVIRSGINVIQVEPGGKRPGLARL